MESIKKIYIEEWNYFRAKVMRPAVFCAWGFAAAAIFYYAAAVQDPVAAQDFFDQLGRAFEEKGFSGAMQSPELFVRIFANNITAGFFIMLSGLVPFVFLPFGAVLFNAALLGVVVAVTESSGSGLSDILVSLLPHGIVEIPALFITAGIGLRVGLVATKKLIGRGHDLSFPRELARAWRFFLLAAVPLFLLAAFIESFITVSLVK